MKRRVFHSRAALVIGFLVLSLGGGGWGEFTSDVEDLQQAIAIMEGVPSGRRILNNATKAWGLRRSRELLSYLRWSDVSRTDAVLSRSYHPETGNEEKTRKVIVYLRRGQSQQDLLLDLAHELTHAASSPAWDPYDPSLSVTQYVRATLESQGGEVDALMSECQVAFELHMQEGVSIERCRRYVTAQAPHEPVRAKVLADFYKLGKWKKMVERGLGAEASKFPHLSAEEPQLFSSTGQAPYPAALIEEYQELTRVACDNSKKRLERLSEGVQTRSPASVASPVRDRTEQFLLKRCR